MTIQTPMTAEQVFDGHDFRTNEGREGDRYYFSGHLSADRVADLYFALYPEHKTDFPYEVVKDGMERTWHVFTTHEDGCYLIAGADPDDPFEPDEFFDSSLCSCKAQQGFEEHPSYYYRHPHPATVDTPGRIPVTWVTIQVA